MQVMQGVFMLKAKKDKFPKLISKNISIFTFTGNTPSENKYKYIYTNYVSAVNCTTLLGSFQIFSFVCSFLFNKAGEKLIFFIL